MSYTLLLRLAGPLQSWGVSSRFTIRETLTEPTKSGAIGLLCAALGWDRSAPTHVVAGRERPLAELAALPFGVRVVRPGTLRRDYHTAKDVLRAKTVPKPGLARTKNNFEKTVVSDRFYLSDAYFLAGFESDDVELLQALDAALAAPHWPLALGRKAFIPSLPVRFALPAHDPAASSIVPLPLAEALLRAYDQAWSTLVQPRPDEDQTLPLRRLVLETGRGAANSTAVAAAATAAGLPPLQAGRSVQYLDVPLSFAPRRFAPRTVTFYTLLSNVSV